MYENLKEVLRSERITVYRLSKMTGIYSPDLYRALNGKIPFYPGWKTRVAKALQRSEEELF